jgi:maltose-binding protein MalE
MNAGARVFLAVFAVLASALVLAGCGKKGPEEIVLWEMMDPEERVVLDEVLAAYNAARPDVRVTHTNIGNEQLRTQYLTATMGGGGPDLVFGPADNAGPYAIAGAVAAVDETFPPEFLGEFLEISFDTLRGHVWMLPAQIGNHLCLLYNRALLPEPPKTLQEMVRVGQELTKDTNGDGTFDQYGLVFDLKEPFWLVPYIGAFGGWVMDPSYRPTLDTPAMADALRFLIDVKANRKVMPQECTYQLADTIFKEGKAAMCVNGHWSWGGYDDAGVDFGIVPIPVNETNGLWPVPMISSRGYYLNVNLKGDRRAKAIDVMKYLTSRETQILFAKRLWVIPSRADAYRDPEVQKIDRIVASYRQYEKGRRMPVVPEMRAIWDAMRPAYQNALNGEATPEEAARAMQQDAERKIREMQR